jgi:XTP/dITP diphosphohydrolase
MEIVLATRNQRKAEEMRRILSGSDITVLTLNDFPDCPEVEEDADTFDGNAVKKAVTIAGCTSKVAVADDSGLEVDALSGAPGVMSARYGGEPADDRANISRLLREMASIPDEGRGARFVCCIALAYPEGKVSEFWGFVEGRIGREPRGPGGFGYDPVFYPLDYDRTFAEMTPEEKDALSHRSRALEKLVTHFKDVDIKG